MEGPGFLKEYAVFGYCFLSDEKPVTFHKRRTPAMAR